ncbi:trna pseudouridine synthase d [Holotrichia oblita]|uniref:Trna pseudouridine synthase d n=1 Tax=Holotrichia oblita TaxID=644536 RepID=A0ACB9THJ0_HOLOL|nr:trna pseudouridine synthase d [Holotrichia oblita]
MHGNNRRGGGRRFGKPYFDKNQHRRYKSDITPEQLCEKDVGITEYISVLDGFSGVLKARFSDFQVNEINVDGEIAKFTDNTPPQGFDSESLSKNIVIPKETPCEDIPQDVWDEILAVVVDGVEDKVVEFESTDFDKEKRGNVHRIVKSILQQKVVASTITRDNKKYITFKKYNKEDKIDNRTAWPPDKEEYVHFLVYKENVDTMEATLKISDCVRINPSSFNYAGVKDRRSRQPNGLVYASLTR